jgi:hypothetical protein
MKHSEWLMLKLLLTILERLVYNDMGATSDATVALLNETRTYLAEGKGGITA